MQRLDVGTSGVMVICKSEHAYSVLKNAFRRPRRRQGLPRAGPGPPRPARGHHRRADRAAPEGGLQVRGDGRRPAPASRTTRRWRRTGSPSLLEVHLETGRTHQIRVHMAALKHPCVGDLTYGADPTLAKRFGLERQWLHAVRLGFEHPDIGRVRRVRVDLPRRPGPRARGHPRCRLTTLRAAPGHAPTTCRRSPSCTSGLARRRTPRCRRGIHPDARGARLGGRAGTCRPTTSGWPRSTASWPATPGSTATWLDDLYVAPGRARAAASARRCSTWSRPSGPAASACGSSRCNEPARGFYRGHGLVELERTDGAGQRGEGSPTSGWPGPAPTRSRFYRGLIDEVDAELGDLLDRRAALTRAVQPHKGSAERDLDREREIARAMAAARPAPRRRPAARIVHAIITESLDAADRVELTSTRRSSGRCRWCLPPSAHEAVVG